MVLGWGDPATLVCQATLFSACQHQTKQAQSEAGTKWIALCENTLAA